MHRGPDRFYVCTCRATSTATRLADACHPSVVPGVRLVNGSCDAVRKIGQPISVCHVELSSVSRIAAWLARSASEYSYTVDMTGATVIDENRYGVAHHLVGDLPGGQARGGPR